MQISTEIKTIADLRILILSSFLSEIDSKLGSGGSLEDIVEGHCEALELPLGMDVIRGLLPESEFMENDAAYVSDVLYKNPTHSLYTIAQVSTQASYRDYAKDFLLESKGLAKVLFDHLVYTPTDDEGCIETPFLDFEKGARNQEVWRWFEEQFNVAIEDLLGDIPF